MAKRRLLTVILSIICVIASAVAADNKAIIDSLRRELAQTTSESDSLTIVSNLFDLLPMKYTEEYGTMAYNLAKQMNDQASALELLRNIANRQNRNESILNRLREQALEWPESEDRKVTLTFIRMLDNRRRVRYGNNNTRQEFFDSLMKEMSSVDHTDIYRQVEVLHSVTMLLSVGAGGELFNLYVDSLGSLVRRLPPMAYSIRNAYANDAASAYAGNNPQKSIELDRASLNNIHRLDKYYKEKGRIYRSFNSSLYIIYSRLLSNFESLTPLDIEEYYRKAMECVADDPGLRRNFESYPAARIYYMLAHKDYRKAANMIQGAKLPSVKRQQMLKHLMECARHLGDDKMLLEASLEYNRFLEEALQERIDGAHIELRIAYNVYKKQTALVEQERERNEFEASQSKRIILISISAAVLLALSAAMLLSKSRSNRLLARSLSESNKQLKTESESLQLSREELIRAKNKAEMADNLKGDFIKNMSYEVKAPLEAITEYSRLIADCADSSGSKHISRFADMLELNAELLATLIEDVLRLTDMESSEIHINPSVVNVAELCRTTLPSIEHRIAPGVELIFKTENEKTDLFTDPVRVRQILINLLTNAAKFTQEGTITLSSCTVPEKGRVEFSVEDTGIGINPANSDKIFERFVKLNPDSQGIGLGLTIARLIAQRLDGDLYLDTDYSGPGARFVLSLPFK